MTGIALIGGIDVCCGLANGDDAVMTTLTGATRLIVIHRDDRRPDGIDVAGLARISGIDVRR